MSNIVKLKLVPQVEQEEAPPLATPKSLEEAIQNGITSSAYRNQKDFRPTAQHVEQHVLDYLAQKVCAAMVDNLTIEELWALIIGGNPKLKRKP